MLQLQEVYGVAACPGVQGAQLPLQYLNPVLVEPCCAKPAAAAAWESPSCGFTARYSAAFPQEPAIWQRMKHVQRQPLMSLSKSFSTEFKALTAVFHNYCAQLPCPGVYCLGSHEAVTPTLCCVSILQAHSICRGWLMLAKRWSLALVNSLSATLLVCGTS